MSKKNKVIIDVLIVALLYLIIVIERINQIAFTINIRTQPEPLELFLLSYFLRP
jgi:hypothetical protein